MEHSHKNEITHDAFREGIIEELGYKPKELSDEKKSTIIKDIEENWWLCGGKDTHRENNHNDTEVEENKVSDRVLETWKKLWVHYFDDKPMPETTSRCVCKKNHLRYNCYITNGDTVLIIGRVCMLQFLPKMGKQWKDTLAKHCERCNAVHRNRKDNICNACRPIVKEERDAEEAKKILEMMKQRLEERKLKLERERQRLLFMRYWLLRSPMIKRRIQKKREARLEQERRTMEEERKRLEQEERDRQEKARKWREQVETIKRELQEAAERKKKEASVCRCGGWKRPEYPECWDCRTKRLANLSDVQKKKLVCSCGRSKKPQFERCFTCNQSSKYPS